MAIEMREHFAETATGMCSSNLCLAAMSKINEMVSEWFKFSKNVQMNAFLGTFEVFSS